MSKLTPSRYSMRLRVRHSKRICQRLFSSIVCRHGNNYSPICYRIGTVVSPRRRNGANNNGGVLQLANRFNYNNNGSSP